MNSIGFPKIFNGNSTTVIQQADSSKSILQWLHLLLSSESGTLICDPHFGLRLKRYMFDQNNYILRDILIDEIYTQITTFCPCVYLERKNISIRTDGYKVYAHITCKDRKTFTSNMFDLVLFESEEVE